MIHWKKEFPETPIFFPQLCLSNRSKSLWRYMDLNKDQWCFNILACSIKQDDLWFTDGNQVDQDLVVLEESILITVYVSLFHLFGVLSLPFASFDFFQLFPFFFSPVCNKVFIFHCPSEGVAITGTDAPRSWTKSLLFETYYQHFNTKCIPRWNKNSGQDRSVQ